jgi:hypothetical protein
MARTFGSAAAFKTSLEAHLRKIAAERATPFGTIQVKFAMERLLARLFQDPNPPWLLKGGFAMDLRFRPRARTTKDIDLSVYLVAGAVDGGALDSIRERLQEAVDVNLGDHLEYRIEKPKYELTNAPGGGARYPCEAILVGKTYARFHIDVGLGEVLVADPDRLMGDDLLSFAGVAPAAALAIPASLQFAEKVHAYSYPWSDRENTRTKDLVDLVIFIERGPPGIAELHEALRSTFANRGTHMLPGSLPSPPASWSRDFPGMADEAGISTRAYLEAFAILERYWTENSLGL